MSQHRNRLTGKARDLRTNSTDAERRLWGQLRSRSLSGFKFRRQFPIGPAIVDFVCLDAALVVAVDGGQHGNEIERDKSRTADLEARGFRVIRFWNHEVLNQTEAVLAEILRQLESYSPHPGPLPANGEREEGKT